VLIALAAVVVGLAVLGIWRRRVATREDAEATSDAAWRRERLRRVRLARRDEP
jgi:hypothetical protein